ncbi:N-acetylmuramic acid 6-phosphate etherase [Wocania ichthyoenteri]|uniref:N-acetylmuramic acid 6-phosphate etherase n=1 Tax=Wocania ichthyoenteri TaxID=1230531 RepID=UPI00053E89D1|nr:N-acetylmuramic acid 6-phosphate etherase [Wocania ichthyoenteri]
MEHFIKTTEQESSYKNLEKMDTNLMLLNINNEDKKVAYAVEKQISSITIFVNQVVDRMSRGGRLFYIGAGTSGRLGILDASECPPTFGVSKDMIVGLIAGGEKAIQTAVENSEDDKDQGWKDLQSENVNSKDSLLGIAASGTTPYVLGTLKKAKDEGLYTGSMSCNRNAPISELVDLAIEVVVGPEFLTGSSRMKAGTAQKLVLNMISTAIMIKMGKVKGNKMVNMALNNKKLINRGVGIIMEELNIDDIEAYRLLSKYGSVKNVLDQC